MTRPLHWLSHTIHHFEVTGSSKCKQESRSPQSFDVRLPAWARRAAANERRAQAAGGVADLQSHVQVHSEIVVNYDDAMVECTGLRRILNAEQVTPVD